MVADGDAPTVDEGRLRATTNAGVWAEEFAKVCPDVDQGLMIGWFANAIEVARSKTLDSYRTFIDFMHGEAYELGLNWWLLPGQNIGDNAVAALRDLAGDAPGARDRADRARKREAEDRHRDAQRALTDEGFLP